VLTMAARPALWLGSSSTINMRKNSHLSNCLHSTRAARSAHEFEAQHGAEIDGSAAMPAAGNMLG
jgi:hypothetical protein